MGYVSTLLVSSQSALAKTRAHLKDMKEQCEQTSSTLKALEDERKTTETTLAYRRKEKETNTLQTNLQKHVESIM